MQATHFLLEIGLGSRFILRKPWVTADAMIAGMAKDRYDGDYRRALRELPFTLIEQVPQASVLLPYSLASRTMEPVVYIRSIMRDMDHDPDLATILDKMPPPSMLTPQEGPLSNVSSSYPTYDIPKIYFIGCGDIDMIESLVRDTPFIGPQRNRGNGQVSSVNISAIETDNPWFGIVGARNGRNVILRPVPLRLREMLPDDLEFVVSNETWHNPYFSGYPDAVVEPCMVPNFVAGESFSTAEIEDQLSHLI